MPFSTPGDLSNPGIGPTSPALAGGFFTTEPPGKPRGWDTKSLKAQTAKWLQLQKVLRAAVRVYPDPESLQRYYSDSTFFQVPDV